jgi:hypothetical protein
MEVVAELTAPTLLKASSAVILPTPIPKPKCARYENIMERAMRGGSQAQK